MIFQSLLQLTSSSSQNLRGSLLTPQDKLIKYGGLKLRRKGACNYKVINIKVCT